LTVDARKSDILKGIAVDRVAQLERLGIDGWNFDLLGLDKEVLNYVQSLEERIDYLETSVTRLEGLKNFFLEERISRLERQFNLQGVSV
jgi:hypothetical protein